MSLETPETTELKNLVVKIDSQILNSQNLCPERYRLEHIEHWRPLSKAMALERGSVQHLMIRRYREGKMAGRVTKEEHGNLVNECILVGKIAASATHHLSVTEFEKDIQVFKEYVLRWQYDGWEILNVEQPFSKILYENKHKREFCGKGYSGITIIYEGVIDALVRDPKIGIAVIDTKTESRRSYPFILSNQFQGYEWAFNVPVIVDKVGYQESLKADDEKLDKSGRDKSKFRRLVHDSGQPAKDEWVRDTIEQIGQAIEWHEQLATGERTSLQKNRTSCDKYSGCIFQKVCAVPEEIRAYKLQAFFFKDRPWDPYARDEYDEEDEVV